MTRKEAVAEQARLFPNSRTLPDICLDLRARINGSADPWPTETVREARAMLYARIETWDESCSSEGYLGRALDSCIKQMATVTVLMADKWLKEWEGQ